MSIGLGDVGPALEEIDRATDRLIDTIGRIGKPELRAPSLLPGWTRAEVITHVARNADSHCNLLTWARSGIETPQYESLEQRDRDIRRGAPRPAAELADDARDSARRFLEAARALPAPAWGATVRAFNGPAHPAWYVVFRRWREVEVHHVDLDSGYTFQDWPDAYVRWELDDTLGALRARGGLDADRVEITDLDIAVDLTPTTDGTGNDRPRSTLQGASRDMLGWLAGRTDGRGVALVGGEGMAAPPRLPPPPVWPLPPAVDWSSDAD